MQHVIGHQVIELKLLDSREAFTLQQTMSRQFWGNAVPALEILFDRLTLEEELVRINRLEIDIGSISEELLVSGKWLPVLLNKLEDAVRSVMENKAPGMEKSPLRVGRFEQWLYFLQYGHLPRHAGRPPASEWEKQILETLGLSAVSTIQLRRLLQTNPAALNRLTLQYPGRFLRHVAELLTGQHSEIFTTVFNEVKDALAELANRIAKGGIKLQKPNPKAQEMLAALFAGLEDENGAPNENKLLALGREPTFSGYMLQAVRTLEAACWKQVLEELVKPGAKPVADELLRLVFNRDPLKKVQPLLAAWIFKNKAKYPELYNFFKRTGGKPDISPLRKKTVPPIGPIETEKIRDYKKETIAPEPQTQQSKDKKTPRIPENGDQKTFPPSSDRFEEEQQKNGMQKERELQLAVEGGMVIKTAGMVLLHPFLNTLFEKTNLIKEHRFDGEWSRQKAALLLHYLATGEPEVAEYDMTLPKLLCAIPLNHPLDHALQLMEEEKSEADELLRAVIEHWGVLGNTSPDGLRGNFLVRDGILTHSETGWRLQVERQTLDVLLNRLPWGIGFVKLPWMPELLRVEWN